MVKQVMHDFGKLGKWSVSTLKANYNSWDGVIAIQEKYASELKRLNENIDYYGKKNVKKMDVSNLSYYLIMHKWAKERLDKLDKDYRKYKNITSKFNKKK